MICLQHRISCRGRALPGTSFFGTRNVIVLFIDPIFWMSKNDGIFGEICPF